MNTLKFGNGEWYGKKDTILAYNDENSNFKPLPFSFDRDTLATRVNKDGLIETVGSGEPRIDYKDDSKGALKLEPTRTNSNINSQNFLASNYNYFDNITITPNSAVSPNGLQNAYKITETSDNGAHYVGQSGWNQSIAETSVSVFAKANGIKYIVLGNANMAPSMNTWFDLENGVVGTQNPNTTNATIENYGNGWYRCSISYLPNKSNTYPLIYLSKTDGVNSYQGDGVSGVYLWGYQIEVNASYATSYIPTQGSIGTRDRELSDTQNLSHVIGQTEGVIFYDAILVHKSTSTAEDLFELSIDDGSNQNIFFINNYNNSLTVALLNGGSYQFTNNSFNPTEGARYKLAFAYKQNDFALYINGNQIATSSSGTVPTMNQITFGNYYNNSANISNSVKVNEFKLYSTRLSNTELQALTTI